MKKNQSATAYDATAEPKPTKSRGTLGGMLGQLPATIKNASTAQKVVGGTLLAVGITLLVRKKKSAPSAQAATLDELLYFVNDRIEGYERAVQESEDPQLRGYYKQLVSQSRQFATDLNTHLTREGGERETRTTLKGKLYRAFMEAQAAVTGHSEKSLLAFNIHGETWALKAYEEALADQTLTGDLRKAVERQNTLSQQTLERLKKLEEKQA
ncbi:MAG: PA2169 family four-helix-bundle protein [Janthinobacterium lividum]